MQLLTQQVESSLVQLRMGTCTSFHPRPPSPPSSSRKHNKNNINNITTEYDNLHHHNNPIITRGYKEQLIIMLIILIVVETRSCRPLLGRCEYEVSSRHPAQTSCRSCLKQQPGKKACRRWVQLGFRIPSSTQQPARAQTQALPQLQESLGWHLPLKRWPAAADFGSCRGAVDLLHAHLRSALEKRA